MTVRSINRKIITPACLISTGVLIGLLCLKSIIAVVLFFIAIAFLVVVWFKEEYGILFIIVITASVINEEQLPAVQTAIGNFHIIDIFFLLFLVAILFKWWFGFCEELIRTPLDKSLLFFWGTALLSFIVAVSFFSVSIRDALSELRIMTYYLIFFLVTNFIKTRSQLERMLHGLYLIAVIVVLFVLVQIGVGDSVRIIPARVESLLTLGKINVDTIRVIPLGNTLIFMMFLVSCCHILLNKVKIHVIAINILLLLGLIIGFNRNLWVPSIFALCLLFVSGTSRLRIKTLAAVLILVSGMIILSLYAFIAEGKLQAYVESTYERTMSLTKGEQLISRDTLIDRVIENRLAYDKIKTYPVFGIGLGNDYREDVDWNPRLNAYVHNGFLWILMKMGLLGFVPFLWFLTVASIRGFRFWKKLTDPYLQSVCIGFTLANIGFMISALVNPVYMQWHSSPIIGLMLGGNEIIYRISNVDTSIEMKTESSQ